jgi:hypothetical protein
MATTKDRLEELARERAADDTLRDLEAAWSAPAVRPRPARTVRTLRTLAEPISGAWAFGSAIAWILLLQIGYGVMPPASPEALAQPVPFVISALDWTSLGLLVVALAGFAARRRWSMAASLGSAAILLSFSVACPVSGHHEAIGAWWFVQLACFGALAAMSAVGLRKA